MGADLDEFDMMQPIPKLESAQRFCDDFFSAPVSRRFLFGVNEYSLELSRHVEFAGFIDDFHPADHQSGFPVFRLDGVPTNALVVSTLLGRPLTGKKLLDARGLRNLDFFAFYYFCGLDLPEVRFWGGHHADFQSNKDRYGWVSGLLEDPESKDVFDRIIGLRNTGNLRYLEGFSDRQQQQYFEPFVKFNNDEEVFVDVGSFDGATSLEFIRRCPNYRAIYAFEPEPHNAIVVRERLAEHRDIHVIQKGLYAREATVRISEAGSASTLDESGTQPVELVRLVDAIDEPVTFIKMDIEGAERDALTGSQAVIERDLPKIAVAVYHKTSDIWAIPQLILGICSDYELRLRHYTEGVVETVMYFLPKPAR